VNIVDQALPRIRFWAIGRASTARKIVREDSLAQAEVNLSKKRFAALRDWYRQFHRKWLYENTTGGVILDFDRRARQPAC
jgi:hypothetical protein